MVEGFLVSEEEEPSEMFRTGVCSELEAEEALEGATSRDDLLAPEDYFLTRGVCLTS